MSTSISRKRLPLSVKRKNEIQFGINAITYSVLKRKPSVTICIKDFSCPDVTDIYNVIIPNGKPSNVIINTWVSNIFVRLFSFLRFLGTVCVVVVVITAITCRV